MHKMWKQITQITHKTTQLAHATYTTKQKPKRDKLIN